MNILWQCRKCWKTGRVDVHLNDYTYETITEAIRAHKVESRKCKSTHIHLMNIRIDSTFEDFMMEDKA